MKKIIELENKTITILYNENCNVKKIPVVVLNTFDEDGQEVWNKTKELANKEYILVTISNIDWNKESKTKNLLMAKVEENTRFAEKYYNNKNIKTIYEENEGNHFQDVAYRIAKGIKWILN